MQPFVPLAPEAQTSGKGAPTAVLTKPVTGAPTEDFAAVLALETEAALIPEEPELPKIGPVESEIPLSETVDILPETDAAPDVLPLTEEVEGPVTADLSASNEPPITAIEPAAAVTKPADQAGSNRATSDPVPTLAPSRPTGTSVAALVAALPPKTAPNALPLVPAQQATSGQSGEVIIQPNTVVQRDAPPPATIPTQAVITGAEADLPQTAHPKGDSPVRAQPAANPPALTEGILPKPNGQTNPLAQLGELDERRDVRPDPKPEERPAPNIPASLTPNTPQPTPPLTAPTPPATFALPADVSADPVIEPLSGIGGDRAAPTTNAPIAPAVAATPGPALAQQVAGQMAVAITAQPGRTVEIALHPRELGNVRLSLTAVDQTITLVVLADRPETTDLMRRHIDVLAQAFKSLGFDDISFSFGGDQATTEQDDTDQNTAAPLPLADDRTSSAPAGPLAIAQTGLDLRI